jgi:hypothetical protein
MLWESGRVPIRFHVIISSCSCYELGRWGAGEVFEQGDFGAGLII